MTLEEIALDIADEPELCVIESYCLTVKLGGRTWYDIADTPACEPAPIKRAVTYLTMRGLLTQHPTRPSLVHIPQWDTIGKKSLEAIGQ